jgi:DNA-binding NtrC family response regulator
VTTHPVPESVNGSTQPNQPASVAKLPALALHFIYPRELMGHQIALVDGSFLGRDPFSAATPEDPTSVVPHATVSRRHAAVQVVYGTPILRDLGSSNGTRVNGQRITESTPVQPQALVRLGDTLAVVDEHDEKPRAFGAGVLPGTSPRMARVCGVLERAAREPSPVLVLGETGTGKEWAAAAVHRASGRTGPYLKLSCAELTAELIESELFGHEKGAFTGAVARHTGLFVAANGGTLFLDEVGELPLELQAKLLRVLQEREVRPVGSVQTQRTDARVICATNVDLANAVEENRFRRDLYARLSFFELCLPALRDRRQDIFGWMDSLAARWSSERNQPVSIDVRPNAAECLALHPWPDNLRGVERLVQRLLAIQARATLGMSLLAEIMPEVSLGSVAFASSPPPHHPLVDTAAGSEPSIPPKARKRAAAADKPTREEFVAVYEATGRSIRATSKHFGRDRRQVYRWLVQFGLER